MCPIVSLAASLSLVADRLHELDCSLSADCWITYANYHAVSVTALAENGVGHGGSFTAEVSDSERLRTPKVELGSILLCILGLLEPP